MLKITVPTPCHEDWNKMTPDQTGRHCSSCAKSVVDFTNMSDDEVKYFFINKKEDERVCGRFKQTQLHRIVIELPPNILSIQMPLWKKFLAACLVVFSTTLFSCDTKIADKKYDKDDLREITIGVMDMPADTTLSPVPSIPPPPEVKGKIIFTPPEVLQGDIMIAEPELVKLVDSVVTPIKDTAYASFTEEPLVMGLTIKPVKARNPPSADSINCNSIKNYY